MIVSNNDGLNRSVVDYGLWVMKSYSVQKEGLVFETR